MNVAFLAVRSVNVHQARTQFSRLIDAAHAGGLVSAAGGASCLTQILECVPMLSMIDSIDLVLPER